MQNYTFRLKPGQDLFDSIEAFIKDRAGIVNAGFGIQENSFWHVLFCERSVARHLCRSTIAKRHKYRTTRSSFVVESRLSANPLTQIFHALQKQLDKILASYVHGNSHVCRLLHHTVDVGKCFAHRNAA